MVRRHRGHRRGGEPAIKVRTSAIPVVVVVVVAAVRQGDRPRKGTTNGCRPEKKIQDKNWNKSNRICDNLSPNDCCAPWRLWGRESVVVDSSSCCYPPRGGRGRPLIGARSGRKRRHPRRRARGHWHHRPLQPEVEAIVRVQVAVEISLAVPE